MTDADLRNLATLARWAGTAAMVTLSSVAAYYPGQKWILIAIAVLGTLGFHVVPTAAQALSKPSQQVTAGNGSVTTQAGRDIIT